MDVKPQKPHTIRYTFSKEEKLCSKKIISGLFQPGFFYFKISHSISHCVYRVACYGSSSSGNVCSGEEKIQTRCRPKQNKENVEGIVPIAQAQMV